MNMGKAKKMKVTIDALFFVTPEQKLIRFLLTEPTTSFTPRVLSSRLKGVRGLGGAEGIKRILNDLQEVGIVNFLNNNQSVCLNNDNIFVQKLKSISALCDLEGIKELLEPLSTKGILFGSRASGLSRSDSNYDIYVVSEKPDEVEKIVTHHPLGKKIGLIVSFSDQHDKLERQNPTLANKLSQGVVMWGSSW